MTTSTTGDEASLIVAMAYKEDKTTLLLGKMAWLDGSNKQHKPRESKGKACNRAGPREGTSTAGKAAVSGQDPSTHVEGSTNPGGYSMGGWSLGDRKD